MHLNVLTNGLISVQPHRLHQAKSANLYASLIIELQEFF